MKASAPAVAPVLESTLESEPEGAKSAPAPALHTAEPRRDLTLHDLLVDAPEASPSAPTLRLQGMCTSRVLEVSVTARKATVMLRDAVAPVEATIAPEVDPLLIEEACAEGERVVLEPDGAGRPLIVAALRTQRPRALTLSAESITLDGTREVVLRAGPSEVRLERRGTVSVSGAAEVTVQTCRGTLRIAEDGAIALESEQEVLLRTAQSAMRLRAKDNEVEIVGSRINASARGLFRIVGRLLRLN